LHFIMPPRAEDIVVEESIAAASAADAVVNGEQFFAPSKQEGQEQEPAEEETQSKAQGKKNSFSSFLSAVEKDLSKIGKSLEDGFIDAIDRTPLGVNADKSAAVRTSSALSSNKETGQDLSSPWYNDAPEGEGSDKPALERKGSSLAKAAKKSAVAVGGGALIGVGVVMIPALPPPFASITMLGGYALLGTEFEGPRKVVKNARDKMRDMKDDDEKKGEEEAKEGEEEESEPSSEIEQEFTAGENEELLLSETQTAAEYFGYSRSDTNGTSEQKDNSNKDGEKKKKTKNPVKKVARKFSTKYVLPALEKVCKAYEKFEDKDQAAKDEGFEVVKDEQGEEEEDTGSKAAVEEQEDNVSAPAEEEKEDSEAEEFVDAKEEWVDVEEDTSDDDAVLVQ
jgi:hypothetical protein